MHCSRPYVRQGAAEADVEDIALQTKLARISPADSFTSEWLAELTGCPSDATNVVHLCYVSSASTSTHLRRRVNMRGTIWKDANLSRANLFGSFAKGAVFTGADLTNADLEVLR